MNLTYSSYSLAEELPYLPYQGHPREEPGRTIVSAADYVYMGELMDEPFPGPEADHEEFLDWFLLTFGMGEAPDQDFSLGAYTPDAFGWTQVLLSTEEQEEHLGLSWRHMEQTAAISSAGSSAAGNFQTVHGPYSPDRLDQVLGAADEHGLREPDEQAAGEGPGKFDLTLLETDGRLVLGQEADHLETFTTEEEQAWTLGDEEHAVAVAEALDEEPWYNAVIWPATAAQSPWDRRLELTPQSPAPLYFDWWGMSLDVAGVEEGEPQHIVRLAYSHEDPEDASVNAPVLERLFAEDRLEEFELLETAVDGGVLTAQVRYTGDQAHQIWGYHHRGEPPFG